MQLFYEVGNSIMSEYDKNKTCCFIGHRKINEADRLKNDLKSAIIDLIENKGVCYFLFGSKSALVEKVEVSHDKKCVVHFKNGVTVQIKMMK